MTNNELILSGKTLCYSNIEFGSTGRSEDETPVLWGDSRAQTISSKEVLGDLHRPVLDIDFPVQAIPSSTPGHSHLFIDKSLSWPDYRKLLNTLLEIGLIDEGYHRICINRNRSDVRLPWVGKDTNEHPKTTPVPLTKSEPVNQIKPKRRLFPSYSSYTNGGYGD